MKKTFRILGAMALCAVMIPAVSSCGGDDDGDEPGNGGVVDVEGTRLTSINGVRIVYDADGRMTQVGSPYGVKIDYSRGTIIVDDDDEEGTADVRFNGHGYLSELSSSWDYTDDEDRYEYRYTGSGKVTFSYNGDGNLTKVVSESRETEKNLTTGGKEDYYDRYMITLTWRDGNLITAVEEGEERDDDGTERWTDTYTYTYGNQSNKYFQMPISVSYPIADDSAYEVLAAVGLFGKGPAMLPDYMRESEVEDNGYTDSHSYNISFSLLGNGAIKTEDFGYHTYNYGYGSSSRSAGATTGKEIKKSTRDFFIRSHRK